MLSILQTFSMCFLIQISLQFVPKGPLDNKSALVQVLAWHQTGDSDKLLPKTNEDPYLIPDGITESQLIH